ncbi:MAG TPA: MliC family protein [Verrucomicrobiota bacterium]|nr:MliC family protein [Verrucomicrobiota bacterium]HNU49766.1 MliC family protein [Verrucomicrobiota bacterium]
MLPQSVVLSLLSVVAALTLASCTTNSRPSRLGTHIGPPVHYQGPDGARFVANYGSLSDGTLHFVKVQMPDGRHFTLPQVVSASGARYTDDRELVWWTHQGTVTVQTRDAAGQWQTRYSELREADAKNTGRGR